MTRLVVPLACLVLLALSAFRPDPDAPVESASRRFFRERVVDVLNRNCTTACHGARPEDVARRGGLVYPVDPESGLIETADQVAAAYGACRGDGAAPFARIDARQPARFSPLVRLALARAHSGAVHPGGDVFASPEEADYRALLRWVEAEIAEAPAAPPAETVAGRFFRESVMPLLVRKNCSGANCHGPQAFNDLKLDPGAGPGERFTAVIAAKNRLKMLGAAAPGAHLEPVIGKGAALASLGDVAASKQLLKNIPLSEGGILHKGGNNFFVSRTDPDFLTLVRWLELEKQEAGAAHAVELGRVRGLVFVRTARLTPRRWWDVEAFQPGSRLMVLPVARGETLETARGPAVDLSAALGLTGREDIRSPAVSYDARRVLFALRRDASDSFHIHEIELDDALLPVPGSMRRLTHGPATHRGMRVHFVDPAYVPDPDDAARTDLRRVSIACASNLAGAVTPSMPRGISGEADGGTTTTVEDLERHEADGSLVGRRIWFVAGANAGAWSRIVGHENRIAAGRASLLQLDPPLPVPVDVTSVYQIEPDPGSLPGLLPAYDIYRMRHAARGEERATFDRTLARVTFTSDQDRGPAMRSSGEIMFTSLRAVQHRDGKPVYNGGIFRALPSGSDFHQHHMNRSGYPLAADNREMASGLEIRVAMDPRNLWGGGTLLLADHQFGPDVEPGNPVDGLAAPFGIRPRPPGAPAPEPPSAVRATMPGTGGLATPHSTFRFLRAAVPLAGELGPQAITPTGVSPGGYFRDPHPLPDHALVVAHDPRALDHLDPARAPDPDLYVLRAAGSFHVPDGDRAGPVHLVRIAAASAPGEADLYPRPLVARLKEPVLHDLWEKHRVDEPRPVRGFAGHPDGTPGFLECYDYHTLDMLLGELSPVGSRLDRARPEHSYSDIEQARAVRLIVVPPVPADAVAAVPASETASGDPASTTLSAGIHTPRAIVAEVPLASDGSFYLEVPSGQPFLTQSLNADGMALRTIDKLFYTLPGERFRMSVPRPMYPMICGGCHGSITGAGADVLRRPDAVSSASRVEATWDLARHERRAPSNAGASSRWKSVDFRRDVQPVLDARCASAACHGSARPAAGLDLTGAPTRHYTRAYEGLLALDDPAGGDASRRKYVAERDAQAIKSYLIEKVTGRELLAPRALSGERPHPPGLSPADVATLVRWIDLGATFRGAPGAAP